MRLTLENARTASTNMNPCNINVVTNIIIKVKIIRIKVTKISREDIAAGTHPYLCVELDEPDMVVDINTNLDEIGCASFVLSRVYICKIRKLEKVPEAWGTAITDYKRVMAWMTNKFRAVWELTTLRTC